LSVALWLLTAAFAAIALSGAWLALRPEDVAESRRRMTAEHPGLDRVSAMPNFAAYRAQREDPERIARTGKRRFMIFTVGAIATLTYILVRS
jgi:hypothetical protein